MSKPGQHKQPTSTTDVTIALTAGGLAMLICTLIAVAVHASGGGRRASWFPPVTVLQLVTGTAGWNQSATVILVLETLAVAAAAVGSFLLVRSRLRARTRVDGAAKLLGTGRDVASLQEKAARAKARDLHVNDAAGPGLPLGRLLRGGEAFASWEDTQVDIWGPRTGKSTSRVIPAIMAAPGAVIATSNKRDLVDATRDPREQLGSRCWVFDPQDMVGEQPRWWWNPLSYVTDDVKAMQLADLFAAGSAAPDAKTDSFFDPEGKDALAALLLAAALDGRPITDVYRWASEPTSAAVTVLARNGYDLLADGLRSQIAAPDKQRSGVFGTAKKMASCLRLRGFQRWITEDGTRRPHLDVEAMIRNGDTMHLLSKEGAGTGGPLVAALTVALIEEGERVGKTSRGGRLATPMLAALDEAANIVRWPQLPDLYSHYGSRGINLMTMLQSWSQGVECWGEKGMNKLWSAANIKVYGGGVAERNFLSELSELVGDYDYIGTSVSSGSGRGSDSVSRQTSTKRIFSVAHLAEWPRGRALVLSSGNRATIVHTVPWMAQPYAADIRASITRHDPTAETTLTTLDHGISSTAAEPAPTIL